MIEIRELSFKYKGGSDYSLKDINLKIKKGECILLCGRSGCGKSTLLKLMNGIIPEFVIVSMDLLKKSSACFRFPFIV